jgi:hypothetical protein
MPHRRKKRRTWEDKAHDVIGKLSSASYRQTQLLSSGKKSKVHRAYSIPEDAQELIKALGMHDRRAAEIKAKTIMEGLRRAGVPID